MTKKMAWSPFYRLGEVWRGAKRDQFNTAVKLKIMMTNSEKTVVVNDQEKSRLMIFPFNASVSGG